MFMWPNGHAHRSVEFRACNSDVKMGVTGEDPFEAGRAGDSFCKATGRPLWNAANIYVPTLLIPRPMTFGHIRKDREG
jgi:hypothetical protein